MSDEAGARAEADPGRLARSIEAALRDLSHRERRRVTEGYFPTRLEILGVSAPEMRDVIRRHRPAWRGLSPPAVLALAESLRRGGTHEGRQCGYEIIEARTDAAALLDREAVERLGTGNDNWASVDSFATKVSGPAWREGRVPDAAVRTWAASEDRWWRRSALVSTVALNQKSRGGAGDARRTLDICERLVGDRDDMVVKGLSWALRALSARDPAAVRTFLDRHAERLGARVRREVRNKLDTGRKSG